MLNAFRLENSTSLGTVGMIQRMLSSWQLSEGGKDYMNQGGMMRKGITALQAANQALLSVSRTQLQNGKNEKEGTVLQKPSQSILDKFWVKMAGMFGHTWTSSYGESPSGIGAEIWSQALSGISPLQIAHGLRETLALGSDFPPSAPKFRKLCFGIPSLAHVKRIVARREIDRFAILLNQFLDNYLLVRVDQKTADNMVRDAYELACDHVMKGGTLPDFPVAEIAAPKEEPRTPAAPEVAKAHLEKLAGILTQ